MRQIFAVFALSFVASGSAQAAADVAAPVDSMPAAPTCHQMVDAGAPAKVFSSAAEVKSKKRKHAASTQPHEGRAAVADDATPTLQADTAACTRQAADRYRAIADGGGWPTLDHTVDARSRGSIVETLRKRLAAEGDLPPEAAAGDAFDDRLRDAIVSFQHRAGIAPSGEVDKTTLAALAVPADMRARQLEASATRLDGLRPKFAGRYVVVNIASAEVEAVQDGRVVERHAGIAGSTDHPSPQIVAAIRGVTFNPTWTLPRSIVENELIPKLAKNSHYLKTAHIEVLNRRHKEIDPRHIDWSDEDGSGLTFRQEPGAKNSLGRLRIDMPNKESVYLHDTPTRGQFAADYRFLSHGCVRVDGVESLAAWLLAEPGAKQDWTPDSVQRSLKEDDDTHRAELKAPVPVSWAYLDAWEDAGGTVHFRPDVYGMDAGSAQPAAQVKASR